MKHRVKGRKLKRTVSHWAALLSNLSGALIKNKKIRTTLAKAKELRRQVESLVTNARNATLAKNGAPESVVHAKRIANRFLRDPGAVKILFEEIAQKVSDRRGGYTRVLKLGRRLGDAAELAVIEFVDYNIEQTEQKTQDKTSAKGKLLKTKRKKK